MSSKKKNNVNYMRIICVFMALLIVILILFGIARIMNMDEKTLESAIGNVSDAETIEIEYPTEPQFSSFGSVEYPKKSDNYKAFEDEIVSKSAVLINVTDNEIIAGRDDEKRIYPASMTKVMTLIVAVENMKSLDDSFTMTAEIIAPLIDAEASRAGFEPNEIITMEDLLYGAILPSGADATVGIAMAISGSEEAFVRLMNEKVGELGLENTHFCNTSGLHDENHYTTPVEMAMIMEYAMSNDICREVLSTYQYTTSVTKEHPEGILLESTMFGRMYGDEVEGAKIEAGKTGYTDEAQNTLVTYGTKGGKEYVAVTALSYDYWLSIHDAFNIYASYIEPKTEINIVAE